MSRSNEERRLEGEIFELVSYQPVRISSLPDVLRMYTKTLFSRVAPEEARAIVDRIVGRLVRDGYVTVSAEGRVYATAAIPDTRRKAAELTERIAAERKVREAEREAERKAEKVEGRFENLEIE